MSCRPSAGSSRGALRTKGNAMQRITQNPLTGLNFILVAAVRYAHHDLGGGPAPCDRGDGDGPDLPAPSIWIWVRGKDPK